MRIGLLSDTHGFLDPAIFTWFEKCDELWHAGDFGPLAILDQLKNFKPLRGVAGNIDGADIREEMPEESLWMCEGMRVYMVHAGGYPGHYDKNARRKIERERPDLFITGHSHILRVMRDPKLGLLHMNPGACGHNGWHKVRTLLRFSITNGKAHDVEAIELGLRGREKKPATAPPASS